jgi:hypothetical protein
MEKQKRNQYMREYYRKKVGDQFGKSKFGIRYTSEEENFIKDNYPKISNRKIGEKLNRTSWAIKKKIQSMGLSRTPEQAKKIINECRVNRKYFKYAENPSWRKMVTLPNKKRILESHYVWSKHSNKEVPKGYVVHHKDLNPKNNSSKNLKLMSKAQHNKLHTSNDGIYGLKKRSEL